MSVDLDTRIVNVGSAHVVVVSENGKSDWRELLAYSEPLVDDRVHEADLAVNELVATFKRYLFQEEPWRADARCRTVGKLDDFFPGPGDSQKAAKAVCAKCPVTKECDDYAVRSNSTYGIWGGVIRHRGPDAKEN